MATFKAGGAHERVVMDEPTLARRRRVMRKTYLFLAPIWLFGLLSVGYAQWWGGVGEGNMPPRFPPPTLPDRDFAFCKIMYTSVRSEPLGMGWSTDYPYAGINLMIRFSELTKAPVSMDHRNDPNHWVVRLTDDELFHCPFTMASDVGTIGFTSEEVARLREYLLKGGFLWVDDFWGTRAWNHWVREIGRVLPSSQYPIVDVPLDHPVFRTLAHVSEVPQIHRHPVLAPGRRGHDVGTWRRQPGAAFSGDRRCPRPLHGRHDAQHRRRGCVGARGGRSGLLRPLHARRLRPGDQRAPLRDESLEPDSNPQRPRKKRPLESRPARSYSFSTADFLASLRARRRRRG